MNLFSSALGRTATVVVLLASTVALAGCVPSSSPSSSPSSTSTRSASPDPVATGPAASTTHGPTATPGTAGTKTTVACTTLVSPDAVYQFNPNFSADTAYRPAAGSPGGVAIAANGTACNWINDTSKDTFSVSIARPASSQLATLKSTAATGSPVSGLGDAAYFTSTNGVGRVDAFSGAYWISATSTYFSTAGDATSIVTAALASAG